MDLIFCYLLTLNQVFFSQPVKRSVIISNKHDISELPHEILKDQESLKAS